MAITLVGTTAASTDTAFEISKSITIPAPAGIQTGDFVVIHAYHNGFPASTPLIAVSLGLSVLFEHYAEFTGTWREVATCYQFIGESIPTAWTMEWDASFGDFHVSAIASAWRGVDTSNPFDVTFSLGSHLVDGENSNNPTCPAITTATDDAVVLLAGAISADDITAAGAPTNYTLTGSAVYAASSGGSQPNIEESTASNANIVVSHREIATAGTETPGAFTNSETMDSVVADYTVWTLSLRALVPDTDPDAFTFTDITDAVPTTVYTSNPVTITGINTETTISVNTGEYSINGGSFTSSSGNVNENDQVRLRITSSSDLDAAVSITLDVGGVTDNWSVTTASGSTGLSFSKYINSIPGYIGGLADRAMAFLSDQGYTTGSLTDRKMAWLGGLGFTGSLNDRLKQWILS